LAHSVGKAFASWQIYTLIALGISALVLSQSAYQAGPFPFPCHLSRSSNQRSRSWLATRSSTGKRTW
jgi:hypothetical protein